MLQENHTSPFKKLGQFSSLPTDSKLIFIGAWLMLAYTRAAVLALPFKRLTRKLKHHREVPQCPSVSVRQFEQAASIGKIVAQAANHTPWQSRCLTQVLVVQRLLARRDIPGQFYLGVRKGCDSEADPIGLSAHAWLQCGELIVNGATGSEQHTKLGQA